VATRKVKIGIEVDKKGATKGIKQFSNTVTKQNKRMRTEFNKTKAASTGLGLNLKTLAGAAGGLFIFSKINTLLRESIKLAGEQASAEAKVAQTIKATGGAAGITADEMGRMASEFQNVTTFGDEVILRGQSMLLTFKQIGKDVFPDATEAMLNLSVAMGTDVKESAIQLGKALNDPITGLTALRRVGITFSKEQENLIKNFQKSGDIASAQKLILKELDSQFGGLARAVALVGEGPLIQFNNIVGDVKELLGDAFIPVLLDATAGFKDFLLEGQKTGSLKATFEGVANTFRFLFAIIQDTFNGLSGIFKIIAGEISSFVGDVISDIGLIVGGLNSLIQLLPDKFVPDGWKEGIADTTKFIEELGKAAQIAGQELFDEGIGDLSKGSAIVEHFKRISGAAQEAKKDVADIPLSTVGGDVVGGDVSDPKATAAAAKAAAAAQKSAEAKAEADRKFIESESQKFDEALTIREEFRRQNLSQDEQDLLAFQDQLKEKNLILREAGFEELDIVGMVIDRKQQIEQASNEQLAASRKSAASDFVANLGVLAGANKKFGAAFKAFAITQTIVDTFVGAQAAFKALAGIPIVGPGLGASAAAAAVGAGFIRVDKIRSQSFQGGGIVGGNSFSGDNVPINVNSREIVLTQGQQRNLLALANGRGGGGTQITFEAPIINIQNGDPETVRRVVGDTIQERIDRFAETQRDASVHELLA